MLKKPLWNFIGETADFITVSACLPNTLYFPLCNSHPFMSSISADLHGDIKTDAESFLLEPVSRLGLINNRSSRNFWLYLNENTAWSATGVSAGSRRLAEGDRFHLQAGLLWQKITRQNPRLGLQAEILSFVPASGEPLEIMLVELTNISAKTIKFTPTAAIPLYCRSLNNLYDHRHVTSLLQRVRLNKFGVLVKPTLLFDEKGHRQNKTLYFVLGTDAGGAAAEYIYATQEEFCGDSANLEAPDAVFKNLPPAGGNIQGREPLAGLKFKPAALRPKGRRHYLILMGILPDGQDLAAIFKKFNTRAKIERALSETKLYWEKKSAQTKPRTADKTFDSWVKWVAIQPELRKIFGCSFLPDFDYGKGGRGWRDLWQDCLTLLLSEPVSARGLLINNFSGVRIDGSNATIIGNRPGDFISDRNNISRVWMDHGIWPLFTTNLYIQQSNDINILLKTSPYFKDHQLARGAQIDQDWESSQGERLKTKKGQIYEGTILEHLLAEVLVQFYNVGPHNHIRLENADWNDALDMAKEHGESVSFSYLYCWGLKTLADLIEKLPQKKIMLLKELQILLRRDTDYADIKEKQRCLNQFFTSAGAMVSGKKITLPKEYLVRNLQEKYQWMHAHLRNKEWLKEGFFNGYYDNQRRRVEGWIKGTLRMTLTGQALAILSGVADTRQINSIFKNACRYLRDKKLKGFRLNSDFKQEQPQLGRAFSFAYGEKENGSIFSHMSVIFAYALYLRGFVREGYAVMVSLYKMAVDSGTSKTYPCLPEYFNLQGRGMYSYLTGSASWFIFTLLTQVFGIRGEYGDLVIEPKLVKEQFNPQGKAGIACSFAGRELQINFFNRRRKDYGDYSIRKAELNGRVIAEETKLPRLKIKRGVLLALARNKPHTLSITL